MNRTTALRRALAAAVAALVPMTLLATVPTPADAAGAGAVDDYAGYDGQRTCASATLPGTAFLLGHLVRKYPGTRAVSTLRACSGDSTSEHKDGRALDWGVDATVPAEKAVADAFIREVLADDAAGNAHALARRMGIMYIIWNDHIWAAYRGFERADYSPCDDPAKCSKTLRHRDHVHISLSRSGAAAQTSFYRSRGVRSVPVLFPGTLKLDPVSTAVTSVDVPASGRVVSTGFKLVRGTTYRLVADGLYRAGPGSQVADAACTWSRGSWTPAGNLRVAGTNPWAGSCDGRHTHETTFTATATDYLRLRIADPTAADNEGSVRLTILREDLPASLVAQRRVRSADEPRPLRRPGPAARALVSETLTVPAASSAGARTTRALRAGARYRVVVTGTARSGQTRFDGACVSYAGRLRSRHTLDLTRPDADHLSLFVQGIRLDLRAPGSRSGCDGRAHRYVATFKPAVRGVSRVRVWDPYTYADNAGALKVTLRRL